MIAIESELMKMSLEIDGNTGNILTKTTEGYTFPYEYSFRCINDYVHRTDVSFEELQALCLGMATYIDEMNEI